MGQDVAVELGQWVWRHFFCHELKVALINWRRLLALACRTHDSRKVPPPSVLLPILPEIAEFVSSMRSIDLLVEINQVAPPPPYEQSEYEKLGACVEAGMLFDAAKQTLTIKALQTIASKLNEQERKEVLAWVKFQAEATKPMINPEKLYGDECLQVELPCSKVPSLFDLSVPDEISLDGGSSSGEAVKK